MADTHAVPETPEVIALHKRLAQYSLGGHWQTREKNPDLVAPSLAVVGDPLVSDGVRRSDQVGRHR